MDGGPDDFSFLMDLVPEGCVPVRGMRFVFFLDENGEERLCWEKRGGSYLSQSIGDMEHVKLDMWMENMRADEEASE